MAEEFLSSYLGEATELVIRQDQEVKELKLLDNGFNIKTEDYDYIFSLLEDDSEVAQRLLELFISQSLPKPDFNDIEFKVENEKGYADLLWKDKKIMLFTKDNEDSYILAKNSSYLCFVLDESLNFTLLLKALS